MRIGQLLGTGRSADVYAIDEAWVLRRYRDSSDATPELAVLSYLSACGYPVPRLGPSPAAATPSDMVLQRLAGPTMLQSLRSGALSEDEGAAILASLLTDLHTIPARLSLDPEDRILHLDLHPDNVMLTPDGPVVIDWRTAAEGPPALDRAMSSLILAQVAVDPASPAATGARSLLAALLPRLDAQGGIPAPHLDRARHRRRADSNLSPHEVALIDEAAALIGELSG
ncbi:aminoglycoside phosphotransferase family protein [Streptomyces sp. JH14]|uniref:phosphotransferase n=1 Tax=Streptomyces sp. JH14 TaxID=2793630 RepID=UPI0023F75757|nr:phosphotransferase [Streptomyces sp. JH14]MDF6043193.1 aminoglycoside phosphotransferase family protein [Streptomyces sp. JH14]